MPSCARVLLRGGLAATLATAVALAAHMVGGAVMPSWLGVLLPWWLAVTVCTVLAGSRFTLPRMGAAVLSSQALFHGLFTVGTPGDPGVSLVAPPGSHLGHGAAHTGSASGAAGGAARTPDWSGGWCLLFGLGGGARAREPIGHQRQSGFPSRAEKPDRN